MPHTVLQCSQMSGSLAQIPAQKYGNLGNGQTGIGKAADDLRGKFHAAAGKFRFQCRFPGKAPDTAVKIPDTAIL